MYRLPNITEVFLKNFIIFGVFADVYHVTPVHPKLFLDKLDK